MKLITDKTIISRQIGSIARRGANLDRSIWETAVNCLAHGQEHGDVTLLGNLVTAMPKGSRAQTLVAWAKQFAPVLVDKDGKASIDKARVKAGEFSADRSDWDLATPQTSPWYEFKAAPQTAEFGLDALEAYLTKLAEGKRKGATEGAMDAATACLSALKALKAMDKDVDKEVAHV